MCSSDLGARRAGLEHTTDFRGKQEGASSGEKVADANLGERVAVKRRRIEGADAARPGGREDVVGFCLAQHAMHVAERRTAETERSEAKRSAGSRRKGACAVSQWFAPRPAPY